MSTLLRFKWMILALAAGIAGGWCYWYFVGCSSGTCPITSNPYNSMGYGAMMGLVLTWDTIKKKKENESTDTTVRTGSED